MATSRIALDPTQYVRINFGLSHLLVEANEGEIKVVVTENQPAITNGAFHRVTDRLRLELTAPDANTWALATTTSQKAVVTEQGPAQVRSGGPLSLDAWGRPKAVIDKSLIHGMFTNSIIPANIFKESINGVEQTEFTNAVSSSGLLELSAGAALNDETVLDSFRSPRYEPNRGHLYSSSVILPTPTAAGVREFGMFTEENGMFFRLKADGSLYACRRTTHNGSGTITTEELIDLSVLSSSFDLSKGNIYDIQAQWRGVGNICFYIGDPSAGYSVLVHEMSILGTLDDLSVANPSLPIAYRCENLGDNVQILSGCVDITSEGGEDANHDYVSIPVPTLTGDLNLSGFDCPALIIRNKSAVNSLRNMRDIQALGLYAYAGARSFLKVWVTRDPTAITLNDQTWTDLGDGFLEYIHFDNPDVATPVAFDTTKAIQTFGSKLETNTTFYTPAIFEGKTEIHQSPGDIFIFTVHRENGAGVAGGVTYEFGQEV